MTKEEYINPFSKESEIYAQKLDEATISRNHEQLVILLDEIEHIIPDTEVASQASLYYSIGTVYSDFAKFKGLSMEESLRKQLYCFRKSIDYIELPEYSEKKFEPYVKGFKISLYTNYANTLSSYERQIEAILQYKKVLCIHDSFGLALGNIESI